MFRNNYTGMLIYDLTTGERIWLKDFNKYFEHSTMATNYLNKMAQKLYVDGLPYFIDYYFLNGSKPIVFSYLRRLNIAEVRKRGNKMR